MHYSANTNYYDFIGALLVVKLQQSQLTPAIRLDKP
jgi:hypothetical protein